MNVNLDERFRARHFDDAEAVDFEGDEAIRLIAPAIKVRAQGRVDQVEEIAQNAVRVDLVDFIERGDQLLLDRR